MGGRARPHQRARAVGRHDGRPRAGARPPRRRTRRCRRLAAAPVQRRDPRGPGLGPRRGRHEGLRRDAALHACGPGPAPAWCPTGRWCSASPPTRRPGGHKGAGPLIEAKREWFEDCTYAVGEVGGFSTTVRGKRLYLIEAAEKGMAWMRLTATGNAGHGSMRHPDNAVTTLAEAVARIGRHEWPVQLTPTMKVLLGAVGRARRHRGDARTTPRRWSRSSAPPRGCSARSSGTPRTRPCSTRATR